MKVLAGHARPDQGGELGGRAAPGFSVGSSRIVARSPVTGFSQTSPTSTGLRSGAPLDRGATAWTSQRAAPRSSAAATSLPSIWSTKGLMITVAAAATTIATVSRNASNELIPNAHAATHQISRRSA